MKILVLNGSPKGKNSITLQTVLYLEKVYPEHDFTVLHVGQRIKAYEKDFSEAKKALEDAEIILFAYPVYTFIAPYQMHRFIELIKENGVDLKEKFTTQITTSKHFYDVTAHKFIEENCHNLGLKYIRGLSADMDDLQEKKGQIEAESFFEQLLFDIKNDIYVCVSPGVYKEKREIYKPVLENTSKESGLDVVILTNCAEDDTNLRNMIEDFKSTLPYKAREVNLRKTRIDGGCLGCLRCSVTGKCVYKDGFDDFLRNEIQKANAIIYAFTISDHYTHSSLKLYDDRQFCNGHRAVTEGMTVGYLISGDYMAEHNLQTIVEARCEVGGTYLAGVATDEVDTSKSIQNLSQSICYALRNKCTRPKNFYGVGGTKIFRDLIYLMRGMMKADHKFYKKHGIYDFPHKKKGRILMMYIIGLLMNLPSVQKKMKGQMNEFIIAPYQKVIEAAKPKKDKY
ncbi:NAD(P)H-dependent oxidoreductase [Oceanirhabdus seepicola]|uniref:NAD(P)H-dependent oxidoreductase n=1 Tax=Oceanirhabdus seepicola TaxID=2828781 RepID=A0A9J6NXV0_9CLOT|nr:NAD(P)H-dependent oxidoreductase [Oceanirhabdus seepicola]MCM1988884.1 NAD(P)H-dependent oxidoreductase [Oceanirhabdus seepicola]